MRLKALSAAAAALTALTTVTVVAPAPASAAAVRIEVLTTHSDWVWEDFQPFTCPTNMVLTGRSHHGDETASTTYHCSFILIEGEQARVYRSDWTRPQRENRADYSVPDHQAVVGRWHEGDENGDTKYRTATIYWRGKQVLLANGDVSDPYKESDHDWYAQGNTVMTGRLHSGDENGTSHYRFATVTVAG